MRRRGPFVKPRGIFVKLVTVFLVIGLIPFLGLSLSCYDKARDRMTETVIGWWLVRQARETAARLDGEVQDMREMIRSWADDPLLADQLARAQQNNGHPELPQRLGMFLGRRRNYRRDLDLLMFVRPDGLILAADAEGAAAPDDDRLAGRYLGDLISDPGERAWIEHAFAPTEKALEQRSVPISTHDWFVSPLVRLARGRDRWDFSKGYPKSADQYNIGFAATVLATDEARPLGALVGLFNWSRIQWILDQVTARFDDPDDPTQGKGSRYGSGYPFLFGKDRDTIIAHDDRSLLGNSLSKDYGLEDFHLRMARAPYGSYEYEYPPGTPKISGYAYTAGPQKEGFGWVVGVGINADEIYADVYKLRDFMLIAALILTGLVILAAAVSSHRITEPVTRLIAYTEEVARGNLDARVDIRTHDEIAVLADSFNKMAEDLKESNSRLIKAEKDAAWREMARQVAHEIKNPLTPIMLSAQQLRRAHQDRHQDFDEILGDSVDTIVDQCESLRKIASDFAAFASFPKRNLQRESVKSLVQGAVDLYRPRVQGGHTEVVCDLAIPDDMEVVVDKDEIRRVFLNLFNNAMEAMGGTGVLTVRARPVTVSAGPAVRIEVQDTGQGIPPEDRHRLFEPYFSTRTGGTGLGLAICQRIVKEHAGTIEVESEVGRGTTMIITLPLAPPPAA